MATQMTLDDVGEITTAHTNGISQTVTNPPVQVPEDVDPDSVTDTELQHMLTLMSSVTAERFNIYQTIKYDEFLWVFEQFADERIADVFVNAMEQKEIPHIEKGAKFITCSEFLEHIRNGVEKNEWTDESYTAIGMVFSHIPENMVVDVCNQIKDLETVDEDLEDEIIRGGLLYGLTDSTVDMVFENGIPDDTLTVIQAKYARTFDEWAVNFVDVWAKRARSSIKPFIEAGVNKSSLIPSTDQYMFQAEKQHFGEMRLTETFVDHLETLYMNTQSYYSRYDDEKERTIWRSVRSPDDAYGYRPSSAESWSENRNETKKMNENVVKSTVKIPGVLFTYESFDAWSEDAVLVEKEWCVLGSNTGRVTVDYTTDNGKRRY